MIQCRAHDLEITAFKKKKKKQSQQRPPLASVHRWSFVLEAKRRDTAPLYSDSELTATSCSIYLAATQTLCPGSLWISANICPSTQTGFLPAGSRVHTLVLVKFKMLCGVVFLCVSLKKGKHCTFIRIPSLEDYYSGMQHYLADNLNKTSVSVFTKVWTHSHCKLDGFST